MGDAPGHGGGGEEGGRKVAFGEVRTIHPEEHVFEEPLMSAGDEPVGLRLYEKGIQIREQKARAQHAVEKQREKEERDAKRATPWTTPFAKGHGRADFKTFLFEQDKWLKGKADNLYRKTKERRLEDRGLIEFRKDWEPSTRSAQIMKRKAQRGDYAGPQSGWKTSFSKYIKTKNAVKDVDDFEPVINEKSRQLVRNVPAHERLHSLAAEREETKMILRAWEHDKSMIDPTTGVPRFHPTILTSAHADAHYEHHLRSQSQSHQSRSPSHARQRSHSHNNGRLPSPSAASGVSTTSRFSRRRSFQQLIDHLHTKRSEPKHQHSSSHELAACTFAPRTNPTSSLILEKAGPRPPLYQQASTMAQWERSVSKSPLSPHSPYAFNSERAPPYFDGDAPAPQFEEERSYEERQALRKRNKQFWARQVRDQVDKDARTQRLRMELINKEQEDCTFQPRISQRSHEIFETSKYAQLNASERAEDPMGWQPVRFPYSKSRSASPTRGPRQPDGTSTASFIKQLEEEHARDREAGARERARLRAASSSLPPRGGSYEPSTREASAARDPAPSLPAHASVERSRTDGGSVPATLRTPTSAAPGISRSGTADASLPTATPPSYLQPSSNASQSHRRAHFASASGLSVGGSGPGGRDARPSSASRSATAGVAPTPVAVVPSPVASPAPAPSPFLSSLQSELKTVMDGWKEFDV
eukprot:TRINITY_DN24716_c0_g1_i1.p1 TRINITY_DN24716_c0_g1~~TRINITY_DN24716_c0_g1_i1.p1  ORF type:complete len:701 (+),score=193.20 TRINITY_DN24716_c0_g1_i1:66-2168(+)